MSFLGKTLGKIVGQSKNGATSDSKLSNPNQDSQLTLTHLRKVFFEYLHPKGDQSIKEEKLYNILPLFIKAFSQSSLTDINDKFDDVGEFCYACSRLLVNEIGKRVHDDSKLVTFFEMKLTDEAADGAGLLNTVNLLASGPPFLIEIMTKCSLPSRLVMCVYLFICLPEPKDSILDQCEFSGKERRILFQKCFHQLLIKLCQNSCTCDELVDGDSLKFLFTIICSTCEQHNVAWRQTAGDALLTLTKNFSPKSTSYVHGNECIKQTLRCLTPGQICSANLIERTELLVTLLTFIRETSISSQILLDDFRLSSGYKIIVDVVLLLEKESSKDQYRRALRNLLFTIEEFVSAGSIELRPNSTNLTMFKIEAFQIPQPHGKGRTVRNIYAFQCLLHIFNRLQNVELCLNVIETIKNIYAKDECNYFILESQNLPFYALDDTSMKVHIKSNEIQIKFIEVLEYIIYELKFVPCKELVSIGLSIQNFSSSKWSLVTANFLLKLIQKNSIYKDAFRELGILEMLVSCLQKFAALLKEKCVDRSDSIQIDNQQKDLGFIIMNILTHLIAQSVENSKLFRQIGGARVAHNMVPYKFCRNQALSIVSTLLLTTAGEDDMSTLLGLMQTAKMEDLELKNAVLKSLLSTLRESHRTRTVFRKSGGFVYVVSVLISMEGSLSIPARAPWDKVNNEDIFSILKTIMSTLTVSMRYEPANAKYFETEVRWKSLCAALRLIGCFEPDVKQFSAMAENFVKRSYDFFQTYFCTLDESCFEKFNTDNVSNSDRLDRKLIYICYIMRLLYDTALDAFDRPFCRQPNRQRSSETTTTSKSIKRSNSFMQTMSNAIDEPFIIHAGAISTIFHLLASVPTSSDSQMAYRLQYNIVNLIKNLLKFERNQQIMSSNCLIDDLLFTCKHVLNDENHFLNASIQHIFERLACQYISAKNLKEYLRSGTVFDRLLEPDCENSANNDEYQNQVLVPLSRVKCLISMTSPRENKKYVNDISFVEFNMMVEGFGCLFLPSVSPQLLNAPSIVAMGMVSVGNDLSVNGGVGSGERVFPPQSGLTYSTWIYIEKFTHTLSSTCHPIQILTLIKHSKIKDNMSSCLSVYLSGKDRSLFVNTEECALQQLKFDDNKLGDNWVKFNCSDLFHESQWIHLCVVFSRSMLKHSTVTLYVNSRQISTQKLNYFNTIVNGHGPPSSTSIHAVIGTLPMFRCQSPVVWRQSSCYLVEDALNANCVQLINRLGPNYIGSFQSLDMDANCNTSGSSALFAEDKLMFGLHPSKMFEMTLAKFRHVYNKSDSKTIGKQLNIPSTESVTPLRILSNTAVQLQGAARTVGAVVIGYMGVRVFQPMPVANTIEHLAGAPFLLALVAIADHVEFMYASVKCLACVLKSNVNIHNEMIRLNGYQLLAMLFKRKKNLINSHVFNLAYSMAVSDVDESLKQTSIVHNVNAFEYLVCDLDIWHDCSSEIVRCLHDKLNELFALYASDNNNYKSNCALVKLFHRIKMLKRILYSVIVRSDYYSLNGLNHVLTYSVQTIKILLTECAHPDDLLMFGQFLASLLPFTNATSANNNNNNLNDCDQSESFELGEEKSLNHVICVRHCLLDIIDELITQNTTNKLYNFKEEFVKAVGFDWFILFMNPKCHSNTIIKSAKILFTLLLNPQYLNKFTISTNTIVNWLVNINIDHLTQTNANQFDSTSTTIPTPITIYGFQMIQANFCKYPHYVQLYYVLFALLFDAQKIKDITARPQWDTIDLNKICLFVFDKSFDNGEQSLLNKMNMDVALDIILIILSMIRTLINTSVYLSDPKVNDYAIILMQIFRFMYHNCDQFCALSQNNEFLNSIILTVYPYEDMSPHELALPTATQIQPFAEAITQNETPSSPTLENNPNQQQLTYKTYLSNHPARKLVVDFLRDLVYDSIVNKPNCSLVDSLLTTIPSNDDSLLKRSQEFTTELLKTIMDHVLSCDLFNINTNNDASVGVDSSASSSQMNALINFIDRLVDKMYEGMYRRDGRELIDSLINLYTCIRKKKCQSKQHQLQNEGSLLNSIQRVVLFQLSRPCFNLAEQINMLDVLHKIQNNKTLVFNTNTHADFYACLTYCLLLITQYSGKEESEARTLLNSAAQRVWLDLYLNKKSQLEDSLRVGLSSSCSTSLDEIRCVIEEPCAKVWSVYWDKRKTNAGVAENTIHNQIQAKLSRVTDGITSLTRVVSLTKKSKKEQHRRIDPKRLDHLLSINEINLKRLREYVDADVHKWMANNEQKNAYLLDEWLGLEKELLRHRSLWAIGSGETYLDKWKLDLTEGPNRMRKKLLNNTQEFYNMYKIEFDSITSNNNSSSNLINNNSNTNKSIRKYKLAESADARQYMNTFRVNSLLNFKLNLIDYLNAKKIYNQYHNNFEQTKCRRVSSSGTDNQPTTPHSPITNTINSTKALDMDKSDLVGEFSVKTKKLSPSSFDSPLGDNNNNGNTVGFIDDFLDKTKKLSQSSLNVQLSDNSSNGNTADLADLKFSDKTKKVSPIETNNLLDNSINYSGNGLTTLSSSSSSSNAITGSNHSHIGRLLEEGEKINYIYRCARVTGLDAIEGLFLFGKEHFYVLDGYTLLSNKDIVDIDSLQIQSKSNCSSPSILYEPLIPKYSTCTSSSSSSSLNNKQNENKKTCSKFAYEDIREVHNRRYLLQEIAMEIFSNDGRNFLLVFSRKCRQKIYDRLIALTPDFNAPGSQSIAGQSRSIQIEQNNGLLNALMGEKSVVQRWQRGQITNFQYLMYLNTLAGRSYNDLMQYPVFPWILSDYESHELDLNSPFVYRDLSKPMGAQTADRLAQFEKRFAEWEDPSGETPPYHYGTHYSSAMIVASYLVRMEPFTQLFLKLQGGHFDLADRMFHSVKDAWLSASKNNMADVKELVPEFFYLPEFLINENKFNLGKKQNGVQLNDVVLPPWAKNDPREFIRVHRMALESDYVSAHLNEWIDLIFGYKQQGQAAVQAHNVFHHLFYEGAVDLNQIDDPLKRNAIVGFINNFGQIPKQLFKKAHPVKKVALSLHQFGLTSSSSNSSSSFTAPSTTSTSLSLISNSFNLTTHSTQTATQTATQTLAQTILTNSQTDHQSQSVVFINHLKNLKPSLQPIKEIRCQIGQIVCTDRSSMANNILVVEQNKYLMPPTYQRYIAWGYADQSIRIGYTDNEKSYTTFENLQQASIFCCCSTNAKTIITAGQSGLVNVWQINTNPITTTSVTNSTSTTTTIPASTNTTTSTTNNNIAKLNSNITNYKSMNASNSTNCASNMITNISGVDATSNFCDNKTKKIHLKTRLYGHMDTITCMAVSNSYHMLVTGSRDKSCIIWDINRWTYVRQLNDHCGAVSAICINDLTGDIATASCSYLYLWNINGQLLASINTSMSSNVSHCPNTLNTSSNASSLSSNLSSVVNSSHVILCIQMSQVNEWDAHNVILTGGSDGVVRMWSLGYVQIKKSTQNSNDTNTAVNSTGTGIRAQSTIDSTCDTASLSDELNQSAIGDTKVQFKNEDSDKSTEIDDDFVLIDSFHSYSTKNALKSGYEWKRELVFRSKLTMHTSYERKDNYEPASVTALAISKDNKTIYVGDSRGRVFSWVCIENPGKSRADHWVRDDSTEQCRSCHVKFSFSERKHHCRDCGGLFCNQCTKYEIEIPKLNINKPVRVCQQCFNQNSKVDISFNSINNSPI